MKIAAIALNTYREALRNKVLYSAVLFAVVLVGVSAFFGSVTIGDQVKVIKDFGLFSLSFFGAVITIICGVSLLNKEIKQKTIYNILSKPVSRWQFIIGKHIGLVLTVSVLVALMGVALVGFVAMFEGHIDWPLLQAVVFCILEVTVVASVAIFFSSVVVTTTLTGLFTLGTYIAGRSISYFKFFTEDSKNTNEGLRIVIKTFDWVLPDLSVFNVSDQIVSGLPISGAYFVNASLHCVAYSLTALLLAWIIFERRELN